jgi:hypothetical protein
MITRSGHSNVKSCRLFLSRYRERYPAIAASLKPCCATSGISVIVGLAYDSWISPSILSLYSTPQK